MNQSFPAQPVAMISGGLGDIGKAAAHAMQRSGCRVSIGDVHPTSPADEGFHYHQVDASNEASVVTWFDAVESHFGQTASVIVANAAIVTIGSVMTATVEEWNRTMHVNLTGAWLTARTGAQRMLAAGLPGRIVFVGSWAGHAPHVHIAAYCAAKAGLRMLAQTMALELADKDILVNEVAPGYVDAGLSGQFFKKNAGEAERARAVVPNKRLIEAEEVAQAIAYLCSPHHRNLTGSTLLIDGGLSLQHGREHRD